jgi:hypothetical protein
MKSIDEHEWQASIVVRGTFSIGLSMYGTQAEVEARCATAVLWGDTVDSCSPSGREEKLRERLNQKCEDGTKVKGLS